MADQSGPTADRSESILPELAQYGPTLKPSQVAEVLSLSVGQVQRNMAAGRLPGTKVNGQWRSRRNDIQEVLLGTWVPPQPLGTEPPDVDDV